MAEKKATGAPAASHKKQGAAQALATHSGGGETPKKYSVESLRANMSTGGGEPIPAGHKWTNEKRRLQPRNPDTGQFTYNSDAQYGLIYKSHGKGNATPVGMMRYEFGEGIKKGDKISINEKVWLAIRDIDIDTLRDYFRHFDEESGEYYSYGELPSDIAGKIEEETTKVSTLKANTLSSAIIRKRGRKSKEEQEAMEQGKTKLGTFDMTKLGKTSKAEMKKAMQDFLDGMTPSEKVTMKTTKISLEKKAKNEAYNVYKDSQGWIAGAPFHQGFWQTKPNFAGTKPAQQPAQQPAPTAQTTAPAPTEPEEPAKEEKQGETPKSGKFSKKPAGLFVGKKMQKNNVNYSNPEQKEFFDDFAERVKRQPKLFNATPEQAAILTGQMIAYMAKKGAFDGMEFND